MSEGIETIQPGWISFRIGTHTAAQIRALLFNLRIHQGTKSQMMRLLIAACHRRICLRPEE